MSSLRLPLLLAGTLLALVARGQSAAGPDLSSNPTAIPDGSKVITSKIGMDYKLGASVPLDAEFTDDSGKTVRMADLLGRRPVLLMPLFFNCQTACPLQSDNLLRLLVKEEGDNVLRTMAADTAGIDVASLRRKSRLLVGRDFDVVMLSLHPKETPADAKRRRLLVEDVFSEGWKKLPPAEQTKAIKSVSEGFRFLVGTPENVRKVTDAMGFRFYYDARKNQMNHVAGSAMLSASGKITGYIMGTDFATKVLADRVALAARNEVGPLGDTMLLGCIMVDPVTGKYTLVYNRILVVACVLTLVTLVGSIALMSRRGPRPPSSTPAGASPA